MATRNLVIVFGDQLDLESTAFEDFDPASDAVWMAESAAEASHVASTKSRIAIFFAAMRHFREELRKQGYRVHYEAVTLRSPVRTLEELLLRDLRKLKPEKVVCVQPGEWRVQEMVKSVCRSARVNVDLRDDTHFISSQEFFESWAKGRKQLRLEYFYRELRKKHRVLVDSTGGPEGGEWNYDSANRGHFGKAGPTGIPEPPRFKPDDTTREVIDLVRKRFKDHPGRLEHFSWPVSRRDARKALRDFVKHRLPRFGTFQDAMWTQEPFLYHSLLSAALNLKLLNPREVIKAAEAAHREAKAPINAVEGFIRQILGWREYVRHIYWSRMPDYASSNALQAKEPLPDFYWDAKTPLTCLRESIEQTLDHGYAHHIQRLMVTGLYSLLLGVDPRQIHEWYLAVYTDAVEWVEMPNVLGMSQYADGGYMSSKPYAATGKYIKRMSNYCQSCPMNPEESTGQDACPFTTLYWDFLLRNRERLRRNQRMSLQLRNAAKLSRDRAAAIKKRANQIRKDPSCSSFTSASDI